MRVSVDHYRYSKSQCGPLGTESVWTTKYSDSQCGQCGPLGESRCGPLGTVRVGVDH